MPIGALSRRNWTPAIPLLSEAVAESVAAPESVLPCAGELIETEGGDVSVDVFVVTVNV